MHRLRADKDHDMQHNGGGKRPLRATQARRPYFALKTRTQIGAFPAEVPPAYDPQFLLPGSQSAYLLRLAANYSLKSQLHRLPEAALLGDRWSLPVLKD